MGGEQGVPTESVTCSVRGLREPRARAPKSATQLAGSQAVSQCPREADLT